MSQRSTKKVSRKNPDATQANERWIVLGICIFLASITWLVFGQTLHHEFINLDDGLYVLKNPKVTGGLTIDGLIWAFTHVHAANWHPLTWISHMLDCQFYGLNAGGHHLTNLLFHGATAILLFLVLHNMTDSLWRSAFVAAVFAIHPLRVESVAWVAERKDVLSGLFFMLTIAAYVRYARRPWSLARYGLVLVLFALGLMSKPMLVSLPFILVLLDYWPLNRFAASRERTYNIRISRQLLLEKLPLLGLAAASCIATLVAQKSVIQPFANISLPLRLGNAFISILVYLRQLFWPSGLAVFYPFPAGGISVWKVIISLGLVTSIFVVTVLLRRRHPYLITGWLWYLIMLGPVIGILQVGVQARADRYTYLPQIGLYLLLTWIAADLCNGWRHRRLLLSTLSALILVTLALSAQTQASYWQNNQSLWTHAIACTSGNAMAYTSLGEDFYAKGNLDEAVAHYQKALQIEPNQTLAHSALGVAFLELRQPNESLAQLQNALETNPNYPDAHYNLGNTLRQLGRVDEALTHYQKALELDPNDAEAENNMAWILATWPEARIRDGARAVALAERADSFTQGRSPVIIVTLAAAYAESGRFSEAVETARRALQLATGQGDTTRSTFIRGQIALYQAGSAFRDRR